LSESTTVAGGSGNDTIILADNVAGVSAEIFGGSGNDSISFNDFTEAETLTKITVAGGAGADSITFSADSDNSGATLGNLSYSSFSESNLAETDILQIEGGSKSTGASFSGELVLGIDFTDALTSIAVTEQSAAVLVSNAAFSGNIASNIVTLSGTTFNVSSVTAVAGTVDTLTLSTGKGAAVLFSTSGGADYVFVQGGSTGTADDSIISVGDLSGVAVSVGSAMTLTFSGQVA